MIHLHDNTVSGTFLLSEDLEPVNWDQKLINLTQVDKSTDTLDLVSCAFILLFHIA